MLSTWASHSASMASPAARFIARSASGVLWRRRSRIEWKLKRLPSATLCRCNSAGISLSSVVFELGTIRPMRQGRVFAW